MKVKYGNIELKPEYPYSIVNSSSDVDFSSIKVDFDGYTLEDLPYKYQEIQLIDDNEKVIFTGYYDSPEFEDIKTKDEEDRKLTINMLSPLKMAQVRCVTLIGSYSVKNAINRVLQPLIDDGYNIEEFNVGNEEITLNFVLEPIEYCMNAIGHKSRIYWFIDEKKNIYVNSIDYLFSKNVKMNISENEKYEDFLKIQPTIETVDYANVINIKNIRLFYSVIEGKVNHRQGDISIDEKILNLPKKIKKGDVVSFINPIIIDRERLDQYYYNRYAKYPEESDPYTAYNFYLLLENTSTSREFYIGYVKNNDTEYKQVYTNTQGISYSDDDGEEAEIVLQRDSFFSNMITGFKYNGDAEITVTGIASDTALRDTCMRFVNNKEIQKLKNLVSKTGQIEKTINYGSKWATITEIYDYAKSLLLENTNSIDSVDLVFEKEMNFKIGDLIFIDMPNFYVKGKFAVTKIKKNCSSTGVEEKISLKKSDLVSSYIDIFRPMEEQTSEDSISTMILGEYMEERVNQTHEIEVVE